MTVLDLATALLRAAILFASGTIAVFLLCTGIALWRWPDLFRAPTHTLAIRTRKDGTREWIGTRPTDSMD